MARRSKKPTRPTRPARARGTGAPARLTAKRLEQVVAEVLGGDYAVAPDKSVWWGHEQGTVLFTAQDDHFKATIQWAPRASPLFEGALEFVANAWNQRDGVPVAAVGADADGWLHLYGTLTVPLGGGVTRDQLARHVEHVAGACYEMIDFFENSLPERRFEELKRIIGVGSGGGGDSEQTLATARELMAQAEALVDTDTRKASSLIQRAADCFMLAGEDPADNGAPELFERVMIKRIENLGNKFLNEPDPAPGRSLPDDDGLAQLAQLQRNIRKRMGLTEDNPLVTPQRVAALLKGRGLQPSLVPGDDEAVIVRVGESDMTVVVSMMELKIFCRFDDLSEIGPSDEQVAVALDLARRWNQDFKALAVRLIGTRLNSDEEEAEPAGPESGEALAGPAGAATGSGSEVAGPAGGSLEVEGYARWSTSFGMTDRQLLVVLEEVIAEATSLPVFWRENIADREVEAQVAAQDRARTPTDGPSKG